MIIAPGGRHLCRLGAFLWSVDSAFSWAFQVPVYGGILSTH